MGKLNQFYLLGRLARPPVERTDAEGRTVVTLAVVPGTHSRTRGPQLEPIEVDAGGAQLDTARALQVGQGVLLRGGLRQVRTGEGDEARSVLVAYAQAIELVSAAPRRRVSGDDDEAASSGRRRRRRPRRRRGGGGSEEGAPAAAEDASGAEGVSGGESGGGPAEAPSAESRPEAAPLPPPKPIAPAPEPKPPAPDPTYKTDMPF